MRFRCTWLRPFWLRCHHRTQPVKRLFLLGVRRCSGQLVGLKLCCAQRPSGVWLAYRSPPALGLLRGPSRCVHASLAGHPHSRGSKGEKAGVLACEHSQRCLDLVGGCTAHVKQEEAGSPEHDQRGRVWLWVTLERVYQADPWCLKASGSVPGGRYGPSGLPAPVLRV